MSVYFIRCGSWVKIGAAKNAYERFCHTQVHNPIQLELVGVIDGEFVEEAALHRRFRKHRGRGEWFHISGELEQFLEKLRAKKESKAALNMQKAERRERRKLVRQRQGIENEVSVTETVSYPLMRGQRPGISA